MHGRMRATAASDSEIKASDQVTAASATEIAARSQETAASNLVTAARNKETNASDPVTAARDSVIAASDRAIAARDSVIAASNSVIAARVDAIAFKYKTYVESAAWTADWKISGSAKSSRTVSTLTRTTWPTNRTMYSSSSGRFGSDWMPLRLSVLTWYWSMTHSKALRLANGRRLS